MAAQPDEEVFVFRTGDMALGVLSARVREVTRMGPLTPLPRTPSFMLGVVGHRGEVLPLIDLLRFFAQGESRPTSRSRFFIGESGSFMAAFFADSVVGLRRVLLADKLPPPLGGGTQAEFLTGVVQSPEFGTLNLLDLAKVITHARAKAVVR